jgi:hypothetical protein
MSHHSEACHPERSTSASNASQRAQSKDPYDFIALARCVKVSLDAHG